MSKRYFSDMKRLKEMRDEEIDTTDIPELDDSFFEKAVIHWPEPKASVTLRVDKDVLDWFKSQGKGYQTRMNAILKAYKEAKSKASDL